VKGKRESGERRNISIPFNPKFDNRQSTTSSALQLFTIICQGSDRQTDKQFSSIQFWKGESTEEKVLTLTNRVGRQDFSRQGE